MMEDNLRRALLIWDGSFAFLWQRPITATIMAITVVTLLIPIITTLRQGRRAQHVDPLSE